MRKNRSIVRLLVVNWSLGILLGCTLAGLLLGFDVGGLRSLIMRSDMAIGAIAMLMIGFSITCGGAVCASAVMRQPEDDRSDLPGLPELPDVSPVPIKARS